MAASLRDELHFSTSWALFVTRELIHASGALTGGMYAGVKLVALDRPVSTSGGEL